MSVPASDSEGVSSTDMKPHKSTNGHTHPGQEEVYPGIRGDLKFYLQKKALVPLAGSTVVPSVQVESVDVDKQKNDSPSKSRKRSIFDTNVALVYAFGMANFGLYAVLFGGVHFFESSRALGIIVHVYSVQYVVLFLVRFGMYYMAHWHHFLLDWCYMTSFILVLYLQLWNDSSTIGVVVFSMVTGPLTMGNIIFQCKLLLHDMDKIISVFVHLIPSWLLYSIRWIHNAPLQKSQRSMCNGESFCEGNKTSAQLAFWMILVPLGLGAAQTLCMRLWINAPFNAKLRGKPGYINSLLFMEQYNCKKFFKRIGYRKRPLWQQIGVDVIIATFASTLPFCTISFLLFHVQQLHFAYLVSTTALCLFFGGNKLQALANAASRSVEKTAQQASMGNAKVVPACAADGAASVANPDQLSGSRRRDTTGAEIPLASEIPLARAIGAVTPYFPFHGMDRFYDIGGFLQEPEVYQRVVDAFAERYRGMNIDKIGSFDARGFVLGAPLALALKKPFFMLRKPGTMPNTVSSSDCSAAYGEREGLCVSHGAIKKGERVLLVDDLVSTGATLSAGIELVRHFGGIVVECGCVIERRAFVDPPVESNMPSRTKLFQDKGLADVGIWAVVSEDALQLLGVTAIEG
jgi:adenine phosphoribosyltransferase